MKLEHIQGTLKLCIAPDFCITFYSSWIDQLRTIPFDQYGEYIRTNIYPALSENERKLWNKSTISNLEIHKAVQDFV